jgi:lipopolysaccharide/colanic/teichoic acid biosynthesis glycosyltransferase
MLKRAFDLVLATLALVCLSPLLLLVAIAIKLDSRGPMLYRGIRIGRHGVPFRLSKFRTMVSDADRISDVVSTPVDDPRITRVGRVLRHLNVDELPQFFDVLIGRMSIVGPRPEVPRYVAMFTEEQRHILDVRPGITDWASLWVGDKGIRLRGEREPETVYMESIRPEKLRLQLEYVRTRSLWVDIVIVARTFKSHVLDRIWTVTGRTA